MNQWLKRVNEKRSPSEKPGSPRESAGSTYIHIYIHHCTITKGITIHRIRVIVVPILRTLTLLSKRVTL